MTSQIEFKWALEQLEAIGFIIRKSNGQGEMGVALTDAGLQHCEAFMNKLGIMDRVCLVLYHNDQRLELAEQEED